MNIGVGRLCLFALLLLFSSAPVFAAQLVNINTADTATLKTLNGIGDVKAQAILDYRTEHGPFATIQDITNVKGIGTVTYNNIKDYITVGDALSASSAPSSQAQQTQADNGTQPASSTSAASSAAPSSASPSFSPLPSLRQPIFTYAGKDRDVIALADVVFEATAYDEGGKRIADADAQFSWTFGDGASAVGKSVSHHWSEPGRYAVAVEAVRDGASAAAQFTVSAYPLSAVLFARGSALVLSNTSRRDLDLSLWRLGGRGALFTIPGRTIVLAGASVPFPQEITHLIPEDATLLFPDGVLALRATSAPEETASSTASRQEPASSALRSLPPAPARSGAPAPPRAARALSGDGEHTWAQDASPTGDAAALAPAAHPEVAAAGAPASGSPTMWWAAAAGLALAAGGSLVAAQRFGKKEWDIVEE